MGKSRTRASAHYLLCAPHRLRIVPDGHSVSPALRALTWAGSAVATALLCLLAYLVVARIDRWQDSLPFSSSDEQPLWPGAILLGCFGGLFAAGFLFAALDSFDRAREKRRPDLVIRVTSSDDLAWRLCRAAHGLTSSPSWVDRTVDPRRRVAMLLWETVRRSGELHVREDAVERSKRHPTLGDAAAEVARSVERERENLTVAARNLEAVCAAARRIDRVRAARAQTDRRDRERAEEEAELRATLAAAAPSAMSKDTEQHADASSGLAAESAAIAELVADADRLLDRWPA